MTKSVFTGKYETLRLLLIEARKSSGFSQTELAQRLARPQSFVSKYERGERRLDVIKSWMSPVCLKSTLAGSSNDSSGKPNHPHRTRDHRPPKAQSA